MTSLKSGLQMFQSMLSVKSKSWVNKECKFITTRENCSLSSVISGLLLIFVIPLVVIPPARRPISVWYEKLSPSDKFE